MKKLFNLYGDEIPPPGPIDPPPTTQGDGNEDGETDETKE